MLRSLTQEDLDREDDNEHKSAAVSSCRMLLYCIFVRVQTLQMWLKFDFSFVFQAPDRRLEEGNRFRLSENIFTY